MIYRCDRAMIRGNPGSPTIGATRQWRWTLRARQHFRQVALELLCVSDLFCRAADGLQQWILGRRVDGVGHHPQAGGDVCRGCSRLPTRCQISLCLPIHICQPTIRAVSFPIRMLLSSIPSCRAWNMGRQFGVDRLQIQLPSCQHLHRVHLAVFYVVELEPGQAQHPGPFLGSTMLPYPVGRGWPLPMAHPFSSSWHVIVVSRARTA